jgi:hypothetical protein
MRKLFVICLLICIGAVVASKIFSQTTPKPKRIQSEVFTKSISGHTVVKWNDYDDPGEEIVRFSKGYDTLIIPDQTLIKVIKIGDKYYNIVKHETTIEESKSQAIFGGILLPPNQYNTFPQSQLLVSPQ